MKRFIYIILIMLAVACFSTLCVGCESCGGEEKYELSLTPAEAVVYKGETITFEVSTDIMGEKIWGSSDYRVATVDKTGKVTALSVGDAFITLTIRNYSVSAKIKVAERPVEIVSNAVLNVSFPAVSLYENAQVDLTAYVTDNGERVSAAITFVSSDTGVATVDNAGKITAKGLGDAEITVSATYDGADLTETVFVTVRQNVIVTLSQVNIEMPSLTAGVPTAVQLNAGVFETGNAVSSPAIEWSSSDENVVTVNSEGLITVSGVGETAVVAKYTSGGKEYYAGATVKVNYVDSALTASDKYTELSTLVGTTVYKATEETLGEILSVTDYGGNALTFSADAHGVTFTAAELVKGDVPYYVYDRFTRYSMDLYTVDYVLTSADDYERMMNYNDGAARYAEKSGYVYVKNDIDMSGKEYTYVPNRSTTVFEFDGGGHTFTGGRTNGFLSNIAGGHYKNLILKNTEIIAGSSYDRAGAFSCSIMVGAVVDNIYVIDPVLNVGSLYNGVGLLTGNIYSVDTTIKNCLTVYNSTEFVGKTYGLSNIMGDSAAKGVFINDYCISPVIERPIGEKRAAVTSGYDQSYVVSNYAMMKAQAKYGMEDFALISETEEGAFVGGVRIDRDDVSPLSVTQIIRGNDFIISVQGANVERIKIGGLTVTFTKGQNIVTVSGATTINLRESDSTFVQVKTADGYLTGFVRIVDSGEEIDRDNIGYWKDSWS